MSKQDERPATFWLWPAICLLISPTYDPYRLKDYKPVKLVDGNNLTSCAETKLERSNISIFWGLFVCMPFETLLEVICIAKWTYDVKSTKEMEDN